MKRASALLCGAAALVLGGAAMAQGADPVPALAPAAPLPQDAPAPAPASPAVDEDNMADELNRRQQIQQTFTLQRMVDGKVIETEQRTVTYSRTDPLRTTESGLSAVDALAQKFDAEVLSKTEAFEEAKLDFVVADLNRDGKMTTEEYLRLVDTWKERGDDAASAEESARERQYRAFVEELEGSGETAPADGEANSRAKFVQMTSGAGVIARDDYHRAWLADFDAADANKDMMLRGEELMRFRALNRAEAL
jgi:polyhydroxyalkanoate synthesis regulator phasin